VGRADPHSCYCQGQPVLPPQYIEHAAADIFATLRAENFLRGLERRPFIERLAHFLGEVNAIHPFREGNGRAQRAFLLDVQDRLI
jgi:cell filamentation protein